MKKKIMMIAVAALVAGLLVVPVIAGGPTDQAGKSNVGHLYLYEKDPVTWDIVDNPMWGKMKYNLSGSEFDFVFNGHDLEAYVDYTLIYYPDPWPGSGLICLGNGTVNEEGDIHIMGSVDTGNLTGAKIWLVLTSDVDCDKKMMIGWNPTEYLFEYDLINFDDTDD